MSLPLLPCVCGRSPIVVEDRPYQSQPGFFVACMACMACSSTCYDDSKNGANEERGRALAVETWNRGHRRAPPVPLAAAETPALDEFLSSRCEHDNEDSRAAARAELAAAHREISELEKDKQTLLTGIEVARDKATAMERTATKLRASPGEPGGVTEAMRAVLDVQRVDGESICSHTKREVTLYYATFEQATKASDAVTVANDEIRKLDSGAHVLVEQKELERLRDDSHMLGQTHDFLIGVVEKCSPDFKTDELAIALAKERDAAVRASPDRLGVVLPDYDVLRRIIAETRSRHGEWSDDDAKADAVLAEIKRLNAAGAAPGMPTKEGGA